MLAGSLPCRRVAAAVRSVCAESRGGLVFRGGSLRDGADDRQTSSREYERATSEAPDGGREDGAQGREEL